MMAYWQAEVTFRTGARAVFGFRARRRHQAYLKAFRRAAEFPGVADRLVITRLPPPRDRRALGSPS